MEMKLKIYFIYGKKNGSDLIDKSNNKLYTETSYSSQFSVVVDDFCFIITPK